MWHSAPYLNLSLTFSIFYYFLSTGFQQNFNCQKDWNEIIIKYGIEEYSYKEDLYFKAQQEPQ